MYPYLDDVTVAGNNIEELRERSKKYEIALQKTKYELKRKDFFIWRKNEVFLGSSKLSYYWVENQGIDR